jgi:hypothetical protein
MRRRWLAAILVLVFVASSVAAFAPGAPIVAGCLFAVLGLAWLWFPGWKGEAKALFAVGVIAIPLVAVFLLPAVQAAREAGIRLECNCHLKQIGCALLNYHDRNGCFPPAYTCDKDGKPMHSWRVLLLPYIESEAFYKKYNFNEPWNGPNNRLLESSMPECYTCRTALEAGKNEPPLTSYVVVTGDDTAFPGCKSRRPGDTAYARGETVLVAEVADSDIHWMEPRDPRIDALTASGGDANAPLTSNHVVTHDYWRRFQPGSGYVVCADASLHYLAARISADEARAILSVNAGEKVKIDELGDRPAVVAGPRWDHVIGLPVFCLSFVALLVLALTPGPSPKGRGDFAPTPRCEKQTDSEAAPPKGEDPLPPPSVP